MNKKLRIFTKVKGLVQKLLRKKKANSTISDEKNIGYETSFSGNKDIKFTDHHIRKV
jgi:hypothetical protein